MLRAFALTFVTGTCLCSQAPDSGLLQRHFEEGEKALAEKRYSDAAKAYEALRQLDARNAEVHAKLGLIYFQSGDFAQAVPILRQALKLKPALPNVDVLIAMSLCELGKYTEAVPGLEKGFHRATDSALKRMTGLQLQRAYTGLQKDKQAVEIALELSQLYPKDPEVLYHVGKILGNFAYLTMRQLSEAAPESPWTILALGEAEESQGAYDLATRHYRHVITLDPRRAGVHYRLGRVLLLQAQKNSGAGAEASEAQQEFERELEIDPTNANAAYELAVIHYRRGQFDKAGDLFKVALTYYPDFQEAQVGMGRVFLALKKPAMALSHLQKAVSLIPTDEVAYYHLSAAYRELGNTAEQQKAIAEFRRLHEARSQQELALLQRLVTKQEIEKE